MFVSRLAMYLRNLGRGNSLGRASFLGPASFFRPCEFSAKSLRRVSHLWSKIGAPGSFLHIALQSSQSQLVPREPVCSWRIALGQSKDIKIETVQNLKKIMIA